MWTQRLEAFSDGVFAIASALPVLAIAVPLTAGRSDLLHAFLDRWPSYLAYLASCSTIGAIWLSHSLITEYLEQAEYLGSDSAERVAVTIYGLTLLVALILLSLLWRYAVRERLVRSDAADDELIAVTSRLTPGLAGYVVLLGLGPFKPDIALIGYLLMALFIIMPFGRAKRRRRDS
jgi:uncharacterized membrane protein